MKQYQQLWWDKHKHPCLDCGKLVTKYAQRCHSCAVKIWCHGSHAPGWKGGKRESYGYVFIYEPNHHRTRNNYVQEHILVWEKDKGKLLPDGWVIHHLNGIKNDNRPQNLVALPNMKHILVLQAKAKRIQELEALLSNQHQLL